MYKLYNIVNGKREYFSASELYYDLKEAWQTSTPTNNRFKALIDKIAWDCIDEEDGLTIRLVTIGNADVSLGATSDNPFDYARQESPTFVYWSANEVVRHTFLPDWLETVRKFA